MPRKPAQHFSRGFSLTELLIVLVVVAILAALLFPVFSSARRRAQDTACITNLQQLGHAMTMYVSDYDGAYPLTAEGVITNHLVTADARLWGDLLLAYLHNGEFPICPRAELPDAIEERLRHRTNFKGYAMNNRLNRASGTKVQHTQAGRPEFTLLAPACTITILDARTGMISIRAVDTATTHEELVRLLEHEPQPALARIYLAQPPSGMRHHGGADYAFADGHVKWLLPTSVRADRKSDGIVPGFGL